MPFNFDYEPYIPKNWVDRIEDYDTGEVLREGTDYCAINMNHIEQGIAQLWNAIGTIGGAIMKDFVITLDGWKDAADLPQEEQFNDVMIYQDIALEGVNELLVPFMFIAPACLHAAAKCGMLNISKTQEGTLRVYAFRIPDSEISGQVLLISTGPGLPSFDYLYSTMPIASKENLGAVIIGDNIDVTEKGLISTDVDAQLDEQIATDQDIEALMDELFNKE